MLPASSTAEAVRIVAAGGPRRAGRAAIGTLLAAKIYGGTVLRERVEDRADNETRFVWLAKAIDGSGRSGLAPPPLRAGATGEWKTSLVFWGRAPSAPAGSYAAWTSSRAGTST